MQAQADMAAKMDRAESSTGPLLSQSCLRLCQLVLAVC